jgi:hypothetical protein
LKAPVLKHFKLIEGAFLVYTFSAAVFSAMISSSPTKEIWKAILEPELGGNVSMALSINENGKHGLKNVH